MAQGRFTRRQVALRGLALATLSRPSAAAAAVRAPTDASPLARLVGVEQLVLLAYREVQVSRRLSSSAQRLTQRLLAHELEHASAVQSKLTAIGGTVPVAPTSVASGDHELAALGISKSLAALRTERDCLRLLLDVEAVAVGAYYDAMSKLGNPELLTLAAEIMASEAQHAVALSEMLHPGDVSKAVPDPFVQGKR